MENKVSGMDATVQAILDFWFLPAGAPGHGAARAEWFRKDERFDRQIGARFGALVDQALDAGLGAVFPQWGMAPAAQLARILVLDQFTRNLGRGAPRAFAGDRQALAIAVAMVAGGADLALPPQQRAFVYMPFEHAEDTAMQAEAIRCFTALAEAAPGFESMLDFAYRHQSVILRFGRFPHRNAVLGRVSTARERAFLALPGSSF